MEPRPVNPRAQRERDALDADLATSWRFERVNELIERHNANFPIEAELAMNPRTRDFVRVNGRSYEREPIDERWILERFPPDREAVMSA